MTKRRRNSKLLLLVTIFGIGVLISYFYATMKPRFQSPHILVVGDSQISFGSGRVFMEFFENFEKLCSPTEKQVAQMSKFGDRSFGAIGVRSSSLDTWTARDNSGKAMICDVDKKWGVNAGVYGIAGEPNRKYVQIGQGEPYQFCKKDRSPFEAMFNDDYYRPHFLMLAFLGNSAERWSRDKATAIDDATRTMEQIPGDVPCVFMTTAPSYSETSNDMRMKAQKHIKQAFRETNSRCSFIEGFTPETIKASQGNAEFFKTNDAGIVIDPQHPNIAAQRNFFALKTPDICRAIFEQLGT